ncbi:sulfatase-like hydrolase/transferase [Mariniflexile sp. AS56]|uniref:sulfatase-like hydrolase/transferase n=1 Tax=Mariniflexile sp. AS56 TaxID=3063957 RepID=UPI0026EA10DF|nr:sulfatase-like hydrolase/transferase [Mariniflexile sp. AS56]MDO7172643.1 sulfatase-like hydrolase/transferase [Mariniflexile sp. AS56]
MTIKNILYSCAIIALFTAGCKETKPAAKAAKKPNILFLFTDDQRAGTIEAMHKYDVKTPSMDQLVQNGTSFTNSYILGATTAAVCSPSRAMLMTGRHYFNIEPNVYAQFAFPLEERGKSDLLTFPEYFKSHGYTTFATGKQHNGTDWLERGFNHIKSAFLGGMTTHFGTKVKDYTPETGWSAPYQDKEKFSSEVFADAAVGFLDNYKENDPFLMYVAFTAPHDPRTAPQEFHDMYPPETIKLPENFMPEHPFEIADDRIRDEVLAPFPRTEAIIQKEISDYYAMITATDAQIGRILKALEASGQAENTIIVFAGDNGLALGQHGLLGKQNVYEHSVGVPLIFCGPNIPKNQKNDALAYLHDVFPTLCGLTGLDIPESIETKDLTPVIKGDKKEVRNSMLYAYNSWPGDLLSKNRKHNPAGGHRAVRKGDYKLIISAKHEVFTYQLFNVKEDSWELNNLIHDERFSTIKDDLMAELQILIDETGDPAQLDKNEFGLFDNIEAFDFKNKK